MKINVFWTRLVLVVGSIFPFAIAHADPVVEVPGSLPTLLSQIPDRTLMTEGWTIDLATHFGLPAVSGPVYQISTSLGKFNIEMLDDDAPLTVANFLTYVNEGSYSPTLVHRSMPGFVIQTGGYTVGFPPEKIPSHSPVVNEPGVSNTRGTLAMAKVGGIVNSATNQWFVNLADNSGGSPSLDTQNGGFTVFARVLGTGMTVPDAIAEVPIFDVSDSDSAFGDLPLKGMLPGQVYVLRKNFVVVNWVKPASILPSASSPLSVIRFRVFNPPAAKARVALANDQLRVFGVKAEATIRIVATDTNGNEVETQFTVAPPRLAGAVAEGANLDLTSIGWGGTVVRVLGVPPGMSFNPDTQHLEGFPRAARDFLVRALVEAGDGSKRWEYFRIAIDALPDWISGNFDLVMERSSDVGNDLGGSLFLRASPNGLASGRLSLAGMNLPFRGQVEKVSDTEATLSVEIPARGRLTENLTVEITLAPDGSASGRVVGAGGEAALAGWKRVWHPRLQPLDGERLGQINLLLDLTPASFADGDPDVPQGTGWVMVRTTPAGRANFVAKLADGSRATGGVFLGPDGEFNFWRGLYRNGGSVVLQGAIDELGAATGTGSWNRPPAPNPAARLYPAGFGNEVDGPVPLELDGGKWIRPGAGETILGIPYDSNSTFANAMLTMLGGGVEDSATDVIDTPLIIDSSNRVTLPEGQANDGKIVVQINRSNGLVNIRALLQDDDPSRPGVVLRRPVVQQLLLAPHLDADRLGGGCFLLRQPPDPNAEPPITNATSPILSGKSMLTTFILEAM
ncbi:MAG: peptidylprolyl isomerase [Verrucomicrobiae bacterium]|nr:peptidylprolyl isomerase [Verrucomicrobiae bacterium]